MFFFAFQLDILKQNDLWAIDPTNESFFVQQNEMYIGLGAQNTISLCSHEEQVEMYNNFRNFYIEAVVQIKKSFNFEDGVYDILDILDPKFAQSFEKKSLNIFKNRFPFVEIDCQQLDNEWREHALLDHNKLELYDSLDVETYWSKVLKIQNCVGKDIFPNLSIVIKFLLILPFSNSSVERVFSKLKITKTDLRNKLSSETISAVMFTKEGIDKNGGANFEPSIEMLQKSWKINSNTSSL